MDLIKETAKRKTFAIISHPDAGKTTLTEKFLLFGGAIQTAGAVKSNKIRKTATSDFMEIEKQRGISVATSVKDSGCGISVENMPKLFEHFFTNKPDGLGMGLSISRSIIEAHGGYMEAANNPDRGATFYFTLPVGVKNPL